MDMFGPDRPPATPDPDSAAAGAQSDHEPSPPNPPLVLHRRHHPWLAAIRNVVLGVLCTLFLVWLILYITKGRFLKPTFERIASGTLHREVNVAGDFQLYFDPITIKFVSEGMTISNPDWAKQKRLFSADRIETRISTIPLIFGQHKVQVLALDNGKVDLEWDKAHKRNSWTFEGDAKPFEIPAIRQAIMQGTVLHYADPQMAIIADLSFRTIRATNNQFESAIRFSGGGTARKTGFTVSGALFTPNATMAGGRNQLALHIDAADTRIDVSGTLAAPTVLEDADLTVDVRGRNLANLFSIAGIAVPETRRYFLRSHFTKEESDYRFTHLRGRFGDSDLAGNLTLRPGKPRLKLIADLSTRALHMADVAPFIGYNPDAAAKGVKAVVRRVSGTPRLLPDAPLRTDELKNFDADVHYRIATIASAHVPVSDVVLALTLDNSLLKLAPLDFHMAGGAVTSTISINARRPLVHTDYDIRISPTPMGRLLAGYGVSESGTSGTLKARIAMSGEGNTVHQSLSSANGRIAIIIPKGTFWTRNAQLAELDIGVFLQKMFEGRLKQPVQINCGLLGFTVHNGIAAADPILIDTTKNVMLGRGGFSFKTEALDLAFRADGKKFSLFSGQSPVGINGYFAKPGINVISPQLIGRAGAAVGLGVIASPLASVLAFIDIGDAKAAACGPVLAGATAVAQRTTKGKPRDDVGRGTTAKEESGNASAGERADQRAKFLPHR